MTVLDYSEYLEDCAQRVTILSSTIEERPANLETFFRLGNCPLCASAAKSVLTAVESSILFPGSGRTLRQAAWECECGWWQTYVDQWDDDVGFSGRYQRTRSAIVCHFDVADDGLPLQTLERYLANHPDALGSISKRKMELLVGSVFSQHRECEVRHVGCTGDGGIDLFIVAGDELSLVQVKQRETGSRRWSAEPAQSVREFLGATLLKGGRSCIFVTTANRFTAPVTEAASVALARQLVDSFELVDRRRFLELLDLVHEGRTGTWEQHVAL
ncbi:MAG: restriction endonuclease [Coriobacteriia bacterium]|nr:restriction endonuclease [Coriobacteriia bacterium]